MRAKCSQAGRLARACTRGVIIRMPQMALDDGRVVFGVPTLLHVLTESGVEMVRGCSSAISSGVYLYEL
jgi:hypothetical protein